MSEVFQIRNNGTPIEITSEEAKTLQSIDSTLKRIEIILQKRTDPTEVATDLAELLKQAIRDTQPEWP